MAKTTRDGAYYAASTNAIHSNAGMVRGLLVNATASTGQITLYDNTTQTGTILMKLEVFGVSPFYVQFPRDHAPRFSTGLSLTVSNATILIWSLDFG